MQPNRRVTRRKPPIDNLKKPLNPPARRSSRNTWLRDRRILAVGLVAVLAIIGWIGWGAHQVQERAGQNPGGNLTPLSGEAGTKAAVNLLKRGITATSMALDTQEALFKLSQQQTVLTATISSLDTQEAQLTEPAPQATLTPTPQPAMADQAIQMPSEAITAANAERLGMLAKWNFGEEGDGLMTIGFSPGGGVLAAVPISNEKMKIQIWNIESSVLLRTLEGTGAQIQNMSFSPDGGWLATGGADGMVRIWQIWSGLDYQDMASPSKYVHTVSFSPEGFTIASGDNDGAIHLWSMDGTLMKTITATTTDVRGVYLPVAFSPTSSSQLASGAYDSRVQIWNMDDGKLVRSMEGHRKSVSALAYSPNGELLATGSEDMTVIVWRVADGALLQTLSGFGGRVTGVAFSPDNKLLATGDLNGGVRLYNVEDGTELRHLTGECPVRSVSFSITGLLLAGGSTCEGVYVWGVR